MLGRAAAISSVDCKAITEIEYKYVTDPFND
jgi:hypothetical protein